MMKRVFITALTAALVLLVGASAWATNAGYNISAMTTAYKTVYSADANVDYRVNIVIRTTLDKYADGGTFAQSADKITWTVTNTDGALIRCKLVSIDNELVRFSESDVSSLTAGSPATKVYRLRLTGSLAKAGTVRVTAALSGSKLKAGTNGNTSKYVDVVFTTDSRDASYNVYKTNEQGDGAIAEDVSASSVAPDSDTSDPRDPDSREWNGLNPPFTLTLSGDPVMSPKVAWAKPEDFTAGTSTDTVVATITGPVAGINVYVAAKDTVKLYGIEKSEAVDILLTSANIKQYNIPFRVTVINSADNKATGDKKTEKDSKTTVTVAFNGGNFEYKGFPLTISAWNKNNESKPAVKTVKMNIKPNDSTPEWGHGTITTSSVLVGGVTTTTTTTGTVSSTYSTSSYTEWMNWQTSGNSAYKGGSGITLSATAGSDYKYVQLKNSSGTPLEVKYHFVGGTRVRYEYDNDNITANIYPARTTYNNTSFGTDNYSAWYYSSYTVEQRGKYWYAAIPSTFSLTVSQQGDITSSTTTGGKYITTRSVSFTSIDLKAKHEIVVGIYPDKETGEQGGSITATEYNVLAPAPYKITAKSPKDEGITLTITQPKFNYLGEVTQLGIVTISGTLSNTTKESKNAMTFTAANPSTGKKAALKVTVLSKTPPSFKKLPDFTFDTSILGDTETDEAFVDSYGYADTRKKVKSKRVIMPKLPKAKFKATGSKTITYKLGLYDEDGNADWQSAYSWTRSKFTEDAELWDYMYAYVINHELASGYGEQFNEELEANLLAHSMSFDAKKGAIVLTEKGAKTTPTLNEDGSKFASIDLAITAVNDVGSAQAWAELPVTGEKPKVADKSVTLSGTVEVGTVFPFKLLGGKTAAESVTEEGGTINVRSYTAKDADVKVLSDWGLELVNYDAMYILVSDEVSFDAGEVIPAYTIVKTEIVDTGLYTDPNSAVVVHANETDSEGNTIPTYYAAGIYGATLKSGDIWVLSKDLSYINYGLIQVVNPDTLAKVVKDAASADSKGKALKKLEKGSKVNLILDNLGAAGKGKITVCLKSDIKSAGDRANYNPASLKNGALPAVNSAAPESARATGNAESYIPNNGTLPDAEVESESEEAESVTIGAPRTIANLTAGQKAFLAEKGYTVIAVLPEISANADGQEDFAVELDEDSPEGAELVYIPFPKNAQETEDDNIADFYDADGQSIEKVPAEKDITVSPWLREGVTYEPVIAAKNAK